MASEWTQQMQPVRERLRRAYEAGRRERAAWLAGPFALVGLAGVAAGPRPLLALAVGGALCALAFAFFWVGREVERAVLPGTMAGLIPFALAQLTRVWGHACLGGQCVALCLPACAAGGVLAGVVVTLLGRRMGASPVFFLAAGCFSALTGALGCSCVGFSGVLGLLAGLVLSAGVGSLLSRRTT